TTDATLAGSTTDATLAGSTTTDATLAGSTTDATLAGSTTTDATLAGSTNAACGGDRILIALSAINLNGAKMQRGDVKVFAKGERYTPPASGEYLEVAVKPNHPRSVLPPRQAPRSPNLHVLFENNDFIVFHESMHPGELGPEHSHFQRLTVTLATTKVEQWTDGKEVVRDLTADTVGFGPALTHTSKALGPGVLSNLSIEFKP
ncbi:MAG TPA: hypothetical protein VG322_02940, partial [Candidatus Acidoferrales bacterium]|nr:hypothetical protein [Candidatus Acidoferrales bacterium]